MEWDEYKKLCDRPNVLSRWMLVQSAEVLKRAGHHDLAAQLDLETRRVLAKPVDHKGGPDTDMFELALEPVTVARICELVATSIAAGARTGATRQRGLAGFAEAWDEYRRWTASR